MRKRRVYLLLISAVVLAGVLVAVCSREREPEYGGKKLSEWVEGYSPTYMSDSAQKPTDEATNAIRYIGTNALPYLLKWIEYEPSALKQKYYDAVEYAVETEHHNSFNTDRKQVRACGAANAFAILGLEAQPAIPELTRVLNNPSAINNPRAMQAAERAASALSYLGSKGLPPLLAVLTNLQAGSLRFSVAQEIRVMGSNAVPGLPVLVQYVKDKDSHLAGSILATIFNLRSEPAVVVPALVNVIEDRKSPHLRYGILILERYGNTAHAAVPTLLRLIGDADLETRKAATNALRAIDPKALETATR